MADRISHTRRVRLERFARSAAIASVAAAALLPRTAQADESFGGGAFIGYHYGERSRLEWGIEAFGTHLFKGAGECTSEARTGAGAFVQLAWLGLESPRLTLAGHGGGEASRAVLGLTGELGATYRFGDGGGFGIHTGVMAETVLLNAAARYQWLRNEAWVGGGARALGTYGVPTLCHVAVGRTMRTDTGPLTLQSLPNAQSSYAANARARIEAIGRAFERDAQLEHASVPAFLQLASELAQLHAPSMLVARALDAARDELHHTALCTQIAARHLEVCARPSLPELAQRAPIASRESLVRLAIESWLDGCVNEGRAAAHAARAAELASDPEVQAVQRTIARDEHRHAELAWSILDWSIARGGEEAHAAVRALRDHGSSAVSDASFQPARDGLEAHGVLGASATHALAAEHFEASQRRLDRLLSVGPGLEIPAAPSV